MRFTFFTLVAALVAISTTTEGLSLDGHLNGQFAQVENDSLAKGANESDIDSEVYLTGDE